MGGSANFAPFVPFDSTSSKGDSDNGEKNAQKKGPQLPVQDVPKEPTKSAEMSTAALDLDSEENSQQETDVVVDTEDAADAKVKKFLNRMRGTCPVGKVKKDKKKEKDDKPPKPIGAGPLEGKEQIKQKKEKKKKERK